MLRSVNITQCHERLKCANRRMLVAGCMRSVDMNLYGAWWNIGSTFLWQYWNANFIVNDVTAPLHVTWNYRRQRPITDAALKQQTNEIKALKSLVLGVSCRLSAVAELQRCWQLITIWSLFEATFWNITREGDCVKIQAAGKMRRRWKTQALVWIVLFFSPVIAQTSTTGNKIFL